MLARLIVLRRLNIDRRAVTAIEYALIASLIAVIIVVAVTAVGSSVLGKFRAVSGGF